jgi:hypothetical protein
LPPGQARVRRYRGQVVVVTCRATGARLKVTLSAVRGAGPGSASLLFDDPAGDFDVQSAETFVPPGPAKDK